MPATASQPPVVPGQRTPSTRVPRQNITAALRTITVAAGMTPVRGVRCSPTRM